MLVVQRFAGILLQMQPLDADGDGLATFEIDDHLALAHDRRFVLADLVALRQVGIKIILAVEHRFQIDLGVEPKPGADRLLDAFLVDHRQHARHGGVDQRYVAVGRAAEFGRGAGEQLRLGRHLGMHLHADDNLPVAGRAFDQFVGFAGNVHALGLTGRGARGKIAAPQSCNSRPSACSTASKLLVNSRYSIRRPSCQRRKLAIRSRRTRLVARCR